jgi:hypothetical protein
LHPERNYSNLRSRGESGKTTLEEAQTELLEPEIVLMEHKSHAVFSSARKKYGLLKFLLHS